MKGVSLILILTISNVYVRAQESHYNIKSHIAAITAIRGLKPIEKLYIQTDKPYYTTGDTLRFKGYLLNADFLTPSERSGLLYVELDGGDGKAAKRIMVPVSSGLASGDIALDSKEIPEGSYTFRAYTNWQRNFGEDYIFKKHITISSTNGGAQLIKAGFAQKNGKIESVLQFTTLDGHVQALKDIQLKVMNGRKNVSKDKLTTGIDGTVNVNFPIPEQASIKDLAIKVQDISKGVAANAQELTIPVTIIRAENTDVQFMPEGGSLVAGIKTKVGIKAIAEDGRGTNIIGTITDSKQHEVARFKTTYAGMGSFEFTPKANESYTAKINGVDKTYSLPAVNQTGTALRLTQTADSLNITVTTTSTSTTNTYYLIGQSRGVVCYAQAINFNSSQPIIKAAALDQFPTGITRFTLIDQNHQPVNERQVFIDHLDNLNISIQTNKANYGIRDSISLAISVKDKNGKPVQGNFSLAVTDDSQVKTDSLSTNIISNLLLTSDLKGTIEDPNYYFINPNQQKLTELDNLLLTQGWVGYSWQEVFHPDSKPIAFQPEKEFTIRGTVTTAFGKPIEKSKVVFISGHPFTIRDTLTNKEGKFIFKDLFPVDTALFKLQAVNKNGKEFNVKIEMEEVTPPEFSLTPLMKLWYINGDSIQLNNSTTKNNQIKAIGNYNGEGRLMKEVVIVAKKVIKGSKNLNGAGESDQVIDEEEIKKADKMTLGDLLEKKIKGFLPIGGIWSFKSEQGGQGATALAYTLDAKKIRFVFDGIDIDFYSTGAAGRYLYIKSILDYYTAEDITGIEVMKNLKYSSKYNMAQQTGLAAESFVFLEITTRSKHGPFMKVTPGTYLYKTLPFTLPKQFYSPKYTVTNKMVAMGTDMRSTIYWESNIITDKDGGATVGFYSADKLSSYSLILEGITFDGSLGLKRQKINVIQANKNDTR